MVQGSADALHTRVKTLHDDAQDWMSHLRHLESLRLRYLHLSPCIFINFLKEANGNVRGTYLRRAYRARYVRPNHDKKITTLPFDAE